MTGPIAVDPAALASTGSAIGGDGESAAAAVQTLSSALSGAGAQFGHDPAGLMFATSYTQSGKALLDAAASAVNACRRIGFGVQMSAANYGHANAASTVGGGEPPVPVPTDPGAFHAPGMPPPLGGGIAAPLGWSLVESFVGQVWPDGDPAQMRATAAAWRSFATAMSGVGGQVGASGTGLGGHEIPDGGQMVRAVGDVQSGLTGIAAQAQALAGQIDGFAATVEGTQDAVRDLLHQLSPSGVLETIGGIFTGHNPIDKIKQIASEIKTVLGNMKREADASGQMFSQSINALDSLTVQFEHWADKQFVNVFGQDVGGAIAFEFNNTLDFSEGGVKFVAQTAEGLKQLDPTRFVYDPQGALKTYEGMAESLATVTNPALLAEKVISDPQGSLDTVKGLVDWDDVEKGRPFAALGYDTAQVGSFFIPGVGEAAPAVDGASAEARIAAEAAGAEGRTGAGAAREAGAAAAGATKATDGITSQAGRIGQNLDNIKVPESTPSAGPSGTATGGRAPVDPTPGPATETPAPRAPEGSAPGGGGAKAPETGAGATDSAGNGSAPVDAPTSGGTGDAPAPAETPASAPAEAPAGSGGDVHPESTTPAESATPAEPAPAGGEPAPSGGGEPAPNGGGEPAPSGGGGEPAPSSGGGEPSSTGEGEAAPRVHEPTSGGEGTAPTAGGAEPPPEPPPPPGGDGDAPPHEVSPSEQVPGPPSTSDEVRPEGADPQEAALDDHVGREENVPSAGESGHSSSGTLDGHSPDSGETDITDGRSGEGRLPTSPDAHPGAGDGRPSTGADPDGSHDPLEQGDKPLEGSPDHGGDSSDNPSNDPHPHTHSLKTDELHHPQSDLLDQSELDAAMESPTRVPDALVDGLPSSDPAVTSLVPEDFDKYGGLGKEKWEKQYWPSGDTDMHGNPVLEWPDPQSHPEGFLSAEDRHASVLQPGSTFDRFGPGFGRFVSPEGTPFPERGLPYHSLDDGYHRYEVLRPLPVWEGRIAPAMGQPGGGIQYYLPYSVVDLKIAGYIREVTR